MALPQNQGSGVGDTEETRPEPGDGYARSFFILFIPLLCLFGIFRDTGGWVDLDKAAQVSVEGETRFGVWNV